VCVACHRLLQEAQEIFGVDDIIFDYEQSSEDEEDEDTDNDVTGFSSLYDTVLS